MRMATCHKLCCLAISKCHWHHCPGHSVRANLASCAFGCPALQGDKFTQDLQCRFGNTSLTYIVNATVIGPQTAYCTSPQWYADNNTRVNFSASTSASDCWSGTEFAYYLDPQVSQVAPLTGPRYGSFELRVQLEETVCSFAEEVGLQRCTLLLFSFYAYYPYSPLFLYPFLVKGRFSSLHKKAWHTHCLSGGHRRPCSHACLAITACAD